MDIDADINSSNKVVSAAAAVAAAMAESTPSTASGYSDVAILSVGIVLAALYLFRDSIPALGASWKLLRRRISNLGLCLSRVRKLLPAINDRHGLEAEEEGLSIDYPLFFCLL